MTAIIESTQDSLRQLIDLTGIPQAEAVLKLARAYEPEDLNVQPRSGTFWSLYIEVCQIVSNRPDAWLKITELAVSAAAEHRNHPSPS